MSIPLIDILLFIVTLLNLKAIRRVSYGLLLRKGKAIGLRTSILVIINKSVSRKAGNNKFIRRIYLYFGLKLNKYEYDKNESDPADPRISY